MISPLRLLQIGLVLGSALLTGYPFASVATIITMVAIGLIMLACVAYIYSHPRRRCNQIRTPITRMLIDAFGLLCLLSWTYLRFPSQPILPMTGTSLLFFAFIIERSTAQTRQ